jgi:hypothetical protein
MILLLVLCCSSDALNEIGDQVRQLLLAVQGKPIPEGLLNWGNTAPLDGWSRLFALHGFPPWSACVAAPSVLEVA